MKVRRFRMCVCVCFFRSELLIFASTLVTGEPCKRCNVAGVGEFCERTNHKKRGRKPATNRDVEIEAPAAKRPLVVKNESIGSQSVFFRDEIINSFSKPPAKGSTMEEAARILSLFASSLESERIYVSQSPARSSTTKFVPPNSSPPIYSQPADFPRDVTDCRRLLLFSSIPPSSSSSHPAFDDGNVDAGFINGQINQKRCQTINALTFNH